MTKLQIVRYGYPIKGYFIKEQMSELCQSSDGKPAMQCQWDRVFLSKKLLFDFHRDTVAAKLATDEEVRGYAKSAGFGMGSSKFAMPGVVGLAVSLTAGAVGSAMHSGKGMAGIVIFYKNPQGYDAGMMVIGPQEGIDQIIEAIPTDKIQK